MRYNLIKLGRDKNGNKTLRIYDTVTEKKFTIQTNGNLPTAHNQSGKVYEIGQDDVKRLQREIHKYKGTIGGIQIIGRRWFQQSFGNTYFSALCYVDGATAISIPFEYGYGDHYIERCFQELDKVGLIKNFTDPDGRKVAAPWLYCKENGITFDYSVVDVDRKKDL